MRIEEDVELSQARIGPNVTVGKGSRIVRSRLSDCIVGEGSVIEDCELKDSLIGDSVIVRGVAGTLLLGDHACVEVATG